jgi:steroid 5-alpha reductase family enzyme
MMTGLDLFLAGWALAAGLMLLAWMVQWRTTDAGIVDFTWAAGLGLLAVGYALLADGDPLRRLLVASMAGLWSFRLAGYILLNRLIDQPEDGRYQQLRAHWHRHTQFKFFAFFQAQALLTAVFAVPFLVVTLTPERPPLLAALVAGFIWILAVGGETLADRQLAAWRADPANRGRTCRAGLWRYSRHPNYFFEWLHWWSYPLLAWGSPEWWLTLLGPTLMLYTLLKVSGIPYTEQQALASRGDDYRAYQRSTSAFIPWFPKKETS